jgi:hypothetical protein
LATTAQEGEVLVKPGDITSFFLSVFGGVRKSRVKTIASLVYGLIRGKKAGVASIGRSMAGCAKEKHRIKRVDRYLGNDGIELAEVKRRLLSLVAGSRKSVIVAIDWSDIGDGKRQALYAACITRSRTVPVMWEVANKAMGEGSQTGIEERFLEALKGATPEGLRVIVVADRGFGRVSFLRKLGDLGFGYVVRVTGSAWVEGRGFKGQLWDQTLRVGGATEFGEVYYHKEARYRTRAVGFFEYGQKEPWLLVTNMGEAGGKIASWYGRRMEIEEMFRDLKNSENGLGLRGVSLKSNDRYDRLLLIMALAYYIFVLAGSLAEHLGLHRRFMANTSRKRTLGLWRVGGFLINKFKIDFDRLLCPALNPVLEAANWG